jgi:hypothetical protein
MNPHRNYQGTDMGCANKRSTTAQRYSHLTHTEFLASVSEDDVMKIVDEWRESRRNGPAPQEKTRESYRKKYHMLVKKYKSWDELTPIENVHELYEHGRGLERESFRFYRHAFLFYFNELSIEAYELNNRQDSLLKAIACLIAINRKPSSDHAAKFPKLQKVKSIHVRHFDALMDSLRKSFDSDGIIARRTHAFAIATLASGVRPCEWEQLEIIAPTIESVGRACLDKNAVVLKINTGKRKINEQTWIRSLVIKSANQIEAIRSHQRMITAYCAKSKSTKPAEDYLNESTSYLKRKCRELWPTHPDRWITIYSLRSQARANFVAKFGGELGSVMIGHSRSVGEKFYTPIKKAQRKILSLRSSHSLIPDPCQDCIVLANRLSETREKNELALEQSEDIVVNARMY